MCKIYMVEKYRKEGVIMSEERIELFFHQINQKIRNEYNKNLESVKLNAEMWAIIKDLHEREEKFNQASATAWIISDRLNIDFKEIEIILDKMVNKDWLVAVQSPTDRRTVSYFLSNKSQSLLSYLLEQEKYIKNKIFKDFSENEREAFIGLLKRIEMNFN